MEKQLSIAGARLAHLLNNSLGNNWKLPQNKGQSHLKSFITSSTPSPKRIIHDEL